MKENFRTVSAVCVNDIMFGHNIAWGTRSSNYSGTIIDEGENDEAQNWYELMLIANSYRDINKK